MYFGYANSKIGIGQLTINRPVGPSCPPTRPLHPEAPGALRNKCYMVRIEGMRPNMRRAAERNLTADVKELAWHLYWAKRNDLIVRLHPGGDFWSEAAGELDWPYIRTLQSACEALLLTCGLPQILAYTHCYDSDLVSAFSHLAPEFRLFASVHGDLDILKARAAGFERFALVMPEVMHGWDGGAWIERHGLKWLVCPEQRFRPDGETFVKTCAECRYCWRADREHVAFLEHSQPRSKQLAIAKAMKGKQRRAQG